MCLNSFAHEIFSSIFVNIHNSFTIRIDSHSNDIFIIFQVFTSKLILTPIQANSLFYKSMLIFDFISSKLEQDSPFSQN